MARLNKRVELKILGHGVVVVVKADFESDCPKIRVRWMRWAAPMIPIPIRVHAMQPAVLFASPATSKLGASTAGPAGPYRQRRSKNPLTTDQWRAPGHTPTAHTSMEIGSGVRLPDRSHPSSARAGGASSVARRDGDRDLSGRRRRRLWHARLINQGFPLCVLRRLLSMYWYMYART